MAPPQHDGFIVLRGTGGSYDTEWPTSSTISGRPARRSTGYLKALREGLLVSLQELYPIPLGVGEHTHPCANKPRRRKKGRR